MSVGIIGGGIIAPFTTLQIVVDRSLFSEKMHATGKIFNKIKREV